MELHFLPVAGVSNGLELLKMFCQSVLYWRNNHFIGRNSVLLSFLGSMVHQECTSSNLEKADFIPFHSLSFFFFSFLIALLIPSRGGKIQSHYHFFIYKNKGNHLVLFYLFIYFPTSFARNTECFWHQLSSPLLTSLVLPLVMTAPLLPWHHVSSEIPYD